MMSDCDRITTSACHSAVQTRAAGVEWEVLNPFVPLERRLWEEAAKPPKGTPVLEGDMAPP